MIRNIAAVSFASTKPDATNADKIRIKTDEYKFTYRLRITDTPRSLNGRVGNFIAASKNMLGTGTPASVNEVTKGYKHNLSDLLRRGKEFGITLSLNDEGKVVSSDTLVATGRGAASRPTTEVAIIDRAVTDLVAGVLQTQGVLKAEDILAPLLVKPKVEEEGPQAREEPIDISVAPVVSGAGRGGN